MKVKVLKPWIVRGRLIAPGTSVDLPAPAARAAIGRGLCRRVESKSARGPGSAGNSRPARPEDGEGD